MPRSMIARRTKLKQIELDSIFEELEREGIIKRTRLRTGRNGPHENRSIDVVFSSWQV